MLEGPQTNKHLEACFSSLTTDGVPNLYLRISLKLNMYLDTVKTGPGQTTKLTTRKCFALIIKLPQVLFLMNLQFWKDHRQTNI